MPANKRTSSTCTQRVTSEVFVFVSHVHRSLPPAKRRGSLAKGHQRGNNITSTVLSDKHSPASVAGVRRATRSARWETIEDHSGYSLLRIDGGLVLPGMGRAHRWAILMLGMVVVVMARYLGLA